MQSLAAFKRTHLRHLAAVAVLQSFHVDMFVWMHIVVVFLPFIKRNG